MLKFSLSALILSFQCIICICQSTCAQDSVAVWVVFKDKPHHSFVPLSPRSLARRSAVHFQAYSEGDYPLSTDYLAAVSALGARRRETVKWVNAASFMVPRGRLEVIRRLSFVKEVVPVGRYRKAVPAAPSGPAKRSDLPDYFGLNYSQSTMISLPEVQHYLTDYRHEKPGTGIVIAVFDDGFVLDHDCLARLRSGGGVIADSDFVGGGIATRDQDGGSHGMQTLSLIAGYAPGSFMGAAWDAKFVLARTENDFAEQHIEEDHWAAALVWAESLGVEIVSSSLGYRTDFTDSLGDYPYSAMNGKATIISRAADSGCSRGVIIVNAMGNDGQSLLPGTINAPADVERVVSVGAVDPRMLIAPFSSTGPTFDGRMKPDLVAMGSSATVPNSFPQQNAVYTTNSGTSFSTPMIAGLAALVLQTHPGPADSVRQRLYRACRFTPYQSSRDNVYGRGIPDGLLACLAEQEVYLVARGSRAMPLPNIVVQSASGIQFAITDSLGTCVLSLTPGQLPAQLRGISPSGEIQQFSIGSTPGRLTVYFGVSRTIALVVRDTAGNRVGGADVRWQTASAAGTAFKTITTNTKGAAVITYPSLESCRIYVAARGYQPSDTILVEGTDSVVAMGIILTPRPAPEFMVYPNAVSTSTPAPLIRFQFIPGSDENVAVDQPMNIVVRNSAGVEVWRKSAYVTPFKPEIIEFDCRNGSGKKLVPGMYFVIVTYGTAHYLKRILISG